MSLFDFFFPEQTQASHLRRLADGQRARGRQGRRQSGNVQELQKRVEVLEEDLGYAALVLGDHRVAERTFLQGSHNATW